MKNFFTADFNRQDLLVGLLMLLLTIMAYWNYTFMLPVLGVILLIVATASIASLNIRQRFYLPFSWIDVCLAVLLLFEVVNYQWGIYSSNSLVFLEKVVFFVIFYYILRIGLNRPFAANVFLCGLSGYALFITLGALFSFLMLQTSIAQEGWTDTSQLKKMYAPFGYLTNEWATIALCFLPFPLITAVLFRSSRVVVIGSIVAFSLVNFGVLVSFARGAYLTLGVFWILCVWMVFQYKLLPIRQLLKITAVAGIVTLALASFISTGFMTTLSMNKTMSQKRSLEGRMSVLQSGMCQAQTQLWTGIGGNNYPLVSMLCHQWREDKGTTSFTNNTYLQLLIEKGIIGTLLYGLFFLITTFFYWKNITQQPDQTIKWIQTLLLVGFLTFAVREFFFSTLFFSKGVMVLSGVFVASINVSSRALIQRMNLLMWCCLGLGVLGLYTWIGIERNHYHQSHLLIGQAADDWAEGKKDKALIKVNEAIEIAPKIAPYHELAGLIAGQTDLPLSQLISNKATLDQQAIKQSIDYYKSALLYNPNDGGYHFNLGWLYFLQQRNNPLALTYLNQAIALHPINHEYILGKGLILESLHDTTAAFAHYEKVIRMDPEFLDSPNFKDLQSRYPHLALQWANRGIASLQKMLAQQHSTILMARMGKLQLEKGDFTAAKTTFQQVRQELPELNRPYHYLAEIALHDGDTTQALALLRKSIFLNPFDYMPQFALADLYYKRLNTEKSIPYTISKYYQTALRKWIVVNSIHKNKANHYYKYGIPTNNDLIPRQMVAGSRMYVDFAIVCTRMAEVHYRLKNEKFAKHYKMLSNRDPFTVHESEIW